MKVKSDPRVKDVFNNYPQKAKQKMLQLRSLVLESATAIETIQEIEETLKWG